MTAEHGVSGLGAWKVVFWMEREEKAFQKQQNHSLRLATHSTMEVQVPSMQVRLQKRI